MTIFVTFYLEQHKNKAYLKTCQNGFLFSPKFGSYVYGKEIVEDLMKSSKRGYFYRTSWCHSFKITNFKNRGTLKIWVFWKSHICKNLNSQKIGNRLRGSWLICRPKNDIVSWFFMYHELTYKFSSKYSFFQRTYKLLYQSSHEI